MEGNQTLDHKITRILIYQIRLPKGNCPMVWVTSHRPEFTIQFLVEQIVASGQLSRHEHVKLTSTILTDYKITDEDRRNIGRVLDYVQIGRLRLVD